MRSQTYLCAVAVLSILGQTACARTTRSDGMTVLAVDAQLTVIGTAHLDSVHTTVSSRDFVFGAKYWIGKWPDSVVDLINSGAPGSYFERFEDVGEGRFLAEVFVWTDAGVVPHFSPARDVTLKAGDIDTVFIQYTLDDAGRQ